MTKRDPMTGLAIPPEPDFVLVRHDCKPFSLQIKTIWFFDATAATWTTDRARATVYPTWRKARNAGKRHHGLTSPAHCHPLEPAQ